jgi:hypothetical protein
MSARVRPYMIHEVAMSIRSLCCRKLERRIAFHPGEPERMRIAPLRAAGVPAGPSL